MTDHEPRALLCPRQTNQPQPPATYRDGVGEDPGEVGREHADEQIEMNLVTQTPHLPAHQHRTQFIRRKYAFLQGENVQICSIKAFSSRCYQSNIMNYLDFGEIGTFSIFVCEAHL